MLRPVFEALSEIGTTTLIEYDKSKWNGALASGPPMQCRCQASLTLGAVEKTVELASKLPSWPCSTPRQGPTEPLPKGGAMSPSELRDCARDGTNLGFGLTPAQALQPNTTGASGD